MDINSFINSIYEWGFNLNLNNNSTLLNHMYNDSNFLTLGLSLIFVSLIFLFVFYKLWDPVKRPRIKWLTTILLVGFILFVISYALLYNNIDFLIYMNEYSGGVDEVNPQIFMLKIAGISFLYGVILSFLLSFLVKLVSVSNKNNPF